MPNIPDLLGYLDLYYKDFLVFVIKDQSGENNNNLVLYMCPSSNVLHYQETFGGILRISQIWTLLGDKKYSAMCADAALNLHLQD